jgi:hypothetical protein
MAQASLGLDRKIPLIRVAVWGQAFGYLLLGLLVAMADAPDYFARIAPTSFLWPILVIAAMHLLRLDRRLAQSLSTPLLAFFVMLPSMASVAMVIAGASFFGSLPAVLASGEDKAASSTLVVSSAYFVFALIANVDLIVASFRAKRLQNQA